MQNINQKQEDEKNFSGDAWYNAKGLDDDVVVSTRVRLARNLASFPFPNNFRSTDSAQIQGLVFDSFNHFPDADAYQEVALEDLEPLGKKILSERGLLEENAGSGLVTRLDGVCACLINDTDHVRLSSFSTGLACEKAYFCAHEVDEKLQSTIQFAASYEFGYLTSSVHDVGSGMKCSLRLHLPSLSYNKKISDIFSLVRSKGLTIKDCYGAGNKSGSSLGEMYFLENLSSFNGNEIDQIAQITSIGKQIAELERKNRFEISKNFSTVVRDNIVRSYATAKTCVLIDLREALEIISTLKWGLDLGILSGLNDSDFSSMLYLIQNGHLEFLLRSAPFSFEKDIQDDFILKENRLRAIIMQKNLDKMYMVS